MSFSCQIYWSACAGQAWQLHAALSVYPKFWGHWAFIYSLYCSYSSLIHNDVLPTTHERFITGPLDQIEARVASKQRIIFKEVCWPKLWGFQRNLWHVKCDLFDHVACALFVFVTFVTKVGKWHCFFRVKRIIVSVFVSVGFFIFFLFC